MKDFLWGAGGGQGSLLPQCSDIPAGGFRGSCGVQEIKSYVHRKCVKDKQWFFGAKGWCHLCLFPLVISRSWPCPVCIQRSLVYSN